MYDLDFQPVFVEEQELEDEFLDCLNDYHSDRFSIEYCTLYDNKLRESE